MNLDFVHIGCSDYDTEVSKASPGVIGLSVEPVKELFLKIPKKPGYLTSNCAIGTFDGKEKIYGIDEETILKRNLPIFFKGESKLGKFPEIFLSSLGYLRTSKIGFCREVEVRKLSSLFLSLNISSTKYLRISANGLDVNIFDCFLSDIQSGYSFPLPEIIRLNISRMKKSSIEKLNKIEQFLQDKGYKIVHRNEDIIFRSQDSQEENPFVFIPCSMSS
jgi:hypothetical protein